MIVPLTSVTTQVPTPFAQHIPSPYESYKINSKHMFPGTATSILYGVLLAYGPPEPNIVPSSATISQEVSDPYPSVKRSIFTFPAAIP